MSAQDGTQVLVQLEWGLSRSEALLNVAHFNVTAIRAHRKTANGMALLAQSPMPELCDLRREASFTRPNVFGRVSGETI